jgi:hypothetical protein
MCVAGIVEVFRQDQCKPGRVLDGEIRYLIIYCYVLDSVDSNLSIYAQLPQNILIGFSQLFAMVASYEYAYYAAPLSAQSLFMSLHFCSIGIASFIGSIYINVFPKLDLEINFDVSQKLDDFLFSFLFSTHRFFSVKRINNGIGVFILIFSTWLVFS